MSGASAAAVDGIYVRFPYEGEHQQPWKSESVGITKVSQPDVHVFMAFWALTSSVRARINSSVFTRADCGNRSGRCSRACA
jgi:hypothetical protein